MSVLPRDVDLPRPLTWEVPVALLGGYVLLAVVLLPVGQGVGAFLFGGGWVWPHGGAKLAPSIGGLLHGRIGAGLAAWQVQQLPAPWLVYAVIALGELLLATGAGLAAVFAWRHLGPAVRPGFATPGVAARALGLPALRRAAPVIRPDLHPRKEKR